MSFFPLLAQASPGVCVVDFLEPSGLANHIRKTGDARCAYCRRLYPAIPDKNCRGCGAAEWETREAFMRGFRMRNINGRLTAKDHNYLQTGEW